MSKSKLMQELRYLAGEGSLGAADTLREMGLNAAGRVPDRPPWEEPETGTCSKSGCHFPVGVGGHRLPEGKLCSQCSEQLRHMARRAPGRGDHYVGVALKPSGRLAIFASWDRVGMIVRGEPIE